MRILSHISRHEAKEAARLARSDLPNRLSLTYKDGVYRVGNLTFKNAQEVCKARWKLTLKRD